MLLTLDGSFFLHVMASVAHLSGRNVRFKMLAFVAIMSRYDCRPSAVLLVITRSSA